MTTFGTELRRLRRASGLSQEVLAARAGLSSEAVSLLERGRRSPRMTTMRLLADGMSLSEPDRAALFAAASLEKAASPPLPVFPDHPVGREDLLASVSALLLRDSTRMVTLLGPAGVGKSRVAVAYAASRPAQFPGGVHWLPMGALNDPPTMAGTLDELYDHHRPHGALLVVDNAEQHLQQCAQMCRAALAEMPTLKIMVASRHLTGIPGELAVPVPPLELPPAGTTPTDLHAHPASALFLARAFTGSIDQPAADAVVRVCHRLDGLPLALELAAARTQVLTVHELADTLDSELDILQTPGPAGGHGLVDAMVSWSYHLLSPQEQLIFARLSVFGAGFARDAVAAVCGDGLSDIEVVEVLSSLVSKSLVERRDDGSLYARFRQLQLIREYARERFAGHADGTATHGRHAEYYARFIERAAGQFGGQAELTSLASVDRELSNLRRAIDWSIPHRPELAFRIVGAMDRWIYLRGRYTDGRRWAAATLQAWPQAPAGLRAPVLALAGSLAFLQCDYDDAEAVIEQARALYSELDDVVGITWATARLGSIARELGAYDRAEAFHREALALARDTGQEEVVAVQLNFLCFLTWLRGRWQDAEPLAREALRRMRALGDREGVVWALINLGTVTRMRGDLRGAELLLTQCLDLCEEMPFREGIAWALNQLGVVARLKGESERAQGLQQASLAEHEQLGDRWREASAYDELAALAADRHDYAAAARHLAAADRLRAEINAPVPAAERADRDATLRRAKRALGSTFEVAALATGLKA